MRMTLLLTLCLLITGCASTIKSGGIYEAQQAINNGEYAKALECTDIVESYSGLTDEQTAKLYYLKAQSLEGLNNQDEAMINYQFVVEQFKNSVYAMSSQQKIEQLAGASAGY